LQPPKDFMIDEYSPEWHAWYRLSLNFGLSLSQKLLLLKHFSLPEGIFLATHRELVELLGESSVLAMQEQTPQVEQGLIECAQWLQKSPLHHVISLADSRYPKGLLDLADPPLLLFANGQTSALTEPALAVVGSRSASPQGLENAKAFSMAMGRAGFTIVSGLALGIDTAAHQGALAVKAATVAVVGTGIDRVYPARNHSLAKEIVADGLVISELALGSPPLPHHFPRRNRLIAALSKGVLVVEAAKESGSLITAKLALEIGREVFAIPGSIHSTVSKGCHQLIRQGAKLVESGQDILEELEPMLPRSDCPSVGGAKAATDRRSQAGSGRNACTPNDRLILQAIGFEPSSVLDIMRRCTLPCEQVQTRLLELELLGQVSRLDDGRLLQIVEAT
jgi:DNA processing protein